MTMDPAALEANELLFVEQHRSAVWDLEAGRLFVSSDREVKTWNFIGALRESAVPWSEFFANAEGLFRDWSMPPCVKVTPSSPKDAVRALEAARWAEAARLTHMVHHGRAITVNGAGIHVRVCANEDEVRVFSEVQSGGFDAPEWFGWVHKVNVVNVRRPHQRFYVAEREGVPAGVTLLLLSGNVAGLYAVATLGQARGRGVARALVARAAEDAKRLGATTLCLNTATGGEAQEAFRRLGFEDVFDSRFLVAPAA